MANELRALSLYYPWGSMFAAGLKYIETRRWGTAYRGLVLLCNGRKRDEECWRLYNDPRFSFPPLQDRSPARPGYAVAIGRLHHVRPMTEDDEVGAVCGYSADLMAWCFDRVWSIPPFRFSGRQGLFKANILEEQMAHIRGKARLVNQHLWPPAKEMEDHG